jgi:hypothetical protein
MEIRHRLTLTLEEDQFEMPTRELARDVMFLADEVKRQSGLSWHTYPKAHEALAEALRMWLEIIKPPIAESAAASDLFGPDDPSTLGRSIARSYQREKVKIRDVAVRAEEIRDRLARESHKLARERDRLTKEVADKIAQLSDKGQKINRKRRGQKT